MNFVNFKARLRRSFSGSVNFQAIFSSDSVNVAGQLSKTTTKLMSQPIICIKFDLGLWSSEEFIDQTMDLYRLVQSLLVLQFSSKVNG